MIDLGILYAILRRTAAKRAMVGELDLARLYHAETGQWHSDEDWKASLADLNQNSAAAGLPPISALVTDDPKQGTYRAPAERDYFGWIRLVAQVHLANWPQHLSGNRAP